MLADATIRKALLQQQINVAPYDERRLQPASLDVTLHEDLLTIDSDQVDEIDPKACLDPQAEATVPMRSHTIPEEGWLLRPYGFCLASTVEHVELRSNVIARVEGKSSLGRLGLLVHCTAGFVDAGWSGQVTLELFNATNLPWRLYPGMPIAQLAFQWLTQGAENPYAGKYQGQRGPQPSRYHRNWNEELASW